jgi:hypothetical protein
MTKLAQAAVRNTQNALQDEQSLDARTLQLKQQKEEVIRTQLAEFAREFEQLKRLHKTP